MKNLFTVLLLGLGLTGAALAGELLARTSETGIRYYVGGVGIDQREALAEQFGGYSLRVEVAEKGGAYTADVLMRIYAADGSKQLDVLQNGPILVADLPPGQYRLEAEQFGQQQTKKVTVKGDRQTRITFLWAPPGNGL